MCTLYRCKLAVGLLSGRYSQPPKNDQVEESTENPAEKKPKVSIYVGGREGGREGGRDYR